MKPVFVAIFALAACVGRATSPTAIWHHEFAGPAGARSIGQSGSQTRVHCDGMWRGPEFVQHLALAVPEDPPQN